MSATKNEESKQDTKGPPEFPSFIILVFIHLSCRVVVVTALVTILRNISWTIFTCFLLFKKVADIDMILIYRCDFFRLRLDRLSKN